jgi:DnaJ-class molecular chaperone
VPEFSQEIGVERMRDPYEVLGVQKSASPEDIKRAFRRLAKKLHPDANKKDAKAAAKFSELNAAYELLGDEKKRKAFDRGEIDAEGKPRFHGFETAGAARGPGRFGREGHFETFTWGPEGFRRSAGRGGGGFGRFEDILGDVFGGMGAGTRRWRSAGPEQADFDAIDRGQDVAAALTITLEEAAKGATKRMRLPTGRDVDVRIPAGLTDGQQIRLKGQGLPGHGGAAGDALISVTIAPHPLFKTEGANLRLELPITLYEAVLGTKVRVPTLEGAVELAIPPGANAGRTFRLKEKGLPIRGGRGDLLVTTRIVLPDRKDPEFEEMMRHWRDTKPYDPRKVVG